MEPSSKTPVGIIDDHWHVRNGLISFVNNLPNFIVTLSAENGEDLIYQKRTCTQFPKIILMDMNMDKMDGMETTKWLYRHNPEVKVIGMSANFPANSKSFMLKHGCVGFLNKDDDPALFIQALEDVAEKGLMSNYTEEHNVVIKHNIKLKERELEFLKWICTDLTMEDISEKMNLSMKSIEGYNTRLHKIFNVHTRQALMNAAYEYGFVQRNNMEEIQ